MLKLAALESNKNQDLEKKEGRIDDLLRVSVGYGVKLFMQINRLNMRTIFRFFKNYLIKKV